MSCDKGRVDIIKNGKGIISLKVFLGDLENNKKQIPQYLIFSCSMTQINYSLKNLGKTFELQKEVLKPEMNHDEVDGYKYKDKKRRMVRLC